MAKKYKLSNQQLKPLGQGLGGQVSNLGHALIVWDIGPRAETKALAQAQREMFFNLQPGEEIEAFGQKLMIKEVQRQELEIVVEAASEQPEESPPDAVGEVEDTSQGETSADPDS